MSVYSAWMNFSIYYYLFIIILFFLLLVHIRSYLVSGVRLSVIDKIKKVSIDLYCLSHKHTHTLTNTHAAKERDRDRKAQRNFEADRQQTAYTDKYTNAMVALSHWRKKKKKRQKKYNNHRTISSKHCANVAYTSTFAEINFWTHLLFCIISISISFWWVNYDGLIDDGALFPGQNCECDSSGNHEKKKTQETETPPKIKLRWNEIQYTCINRRTKRNETECILQIRIDCCFKNWSPKEKFQQISSQRQVTIESKSLYWAKHTWKMVSSIQQGATTPEVSIPWNFWFNFIIFHIVAWLQFKPLT